MNYFQDTIHTVLTNSSSLPSNCSLKLLLFARQLPVFSKTHLLMSCFTEESDHFPMLLHNKSLHLLGEGKSFNVK